MSIYFVDIPELWNENMWRIDGQTEPYNFSLKDCHIQFWSEIQDDKLNGQAVVNFYLYWFSLWLKYGRQGSSLKN